MSELAKIAFMGSDAIGVPVLERLHELNGTQWELAGVISQPDRPVGRGQQLRANPLAARAQELELTVHKPEKPDAALTQWLQDEDVKLVVVMAYGHILKPDLLATPPLGFVNLHASLLPKYRGASPIQSAIAEGETQTGVSLMRVEPAMDSGAVCAVECVTITPDDTAGSVWDKLAKASAELTARELPSVLEGNATFIEQDHDAATYTRKLNKEDGWLDFMQAASTVANRARAVAPWPGSFCEHEGTRLKLAQVRALEDDSGKKPGTVLGLTDGKLRVACGTGQLAIGMLQRPGGKLLPAEDFLRGYGLREGSPLTSGEMKPLVRDSIKG